VQAQKYILEQVCGSIRIVGYDQRCSKHYALVTIVYFSQSFQASSLQT